MNALCAVALTAAITLVLLVAVVTFLGAAAMGFSDADYRCWDGAIQSRRLLFDFALTVWTPVEPEVAC